MAMQQIQVEPEQAGERLDLFLVGQLGEYSRATIRRAIQAGDVLVDGKRPKASFRLRGREHVQVQIEQQPRDLPVPEPMELEILYEDADLAVVNKAPGVVVHPGKGHWSGTLAAGLTHHFQQLSTYGGATRPGIVHRLDRDTSGVLVVAKHDQAHQGIAQQFADRTVAKEYLAIVRGVPDRDQDRIQLPIGVHPYQREKMAVRGGHATSRDAETVYEVAERFRHHALIRVRPRTGRTHQIRVHLTHQGYPILCDKLYAGHGSITARQLLRDGADQPESPPLLNRQALHAYRLQLVHPRDGRALEFIAPVPSDIQAVLDCLRTNQS